VLDLINAEHGEEGLWLFPGGKFMHCWQWYSKQALMLLSTPSPSPTQPGIQSIPVIPWEPLTVAVSLPYLITNGLLLMKVSP